MNSGKCEHCTSYRIQVKAHRTSFEYCDKGHALRPEKCPDFSREPGADDELAELVAQAQELDMGY